jgi:hypothetical protein
MRLFLLSILLFASLTHAVTDKMITTKPTPLNDPNSSQSRQLNSLNAEKSSLQKRRNDLEDKQDFWHKVYLGSVIIAVIVGVLLGLLSWLSQHLESKNVYTERPITARIATIDDEIGEIQKQDSELKIKNAESDAAGARREAEDAKKRAGELEKEAAEERSRAAKLEHDTEELKKQNLVTEQRLTVANAQIELEKAERLELEEAIAPRIMVVWPVNGKPNIDVLRPISWMKVKLQYVPEAEAERAAYAVQSVLKDTGFTDVSFEARPDLNFSHFDGVVIEVYDPPMLSKEDSNNPARILRHSAEVLRSREKSREIGKVFEDFFKSENWAVRVDFSMALQPDEIRIVVGFKPNPSPEERQMIEQYKKALEERQKNLQNLMPRK